MKMLMLLYSGADRLRISSLLDEHHAGYTEFRNGHGAGSTGKRDGSRVWPGESTLYLSVPTAEHADGLIEALRSESKRLPSGERLHVAVLATETFF